MENLKHLCYTTNGTILGGVGSQLTCPVGPVLSVNTTSLLQKILMIVPMGKIRRTHIEVTHGYIYQWVTPV